MLADLAISFIMGLLIGAAYFVGLWLTVFRLTGMGLAPAWLFISAVVRLALLVATLFWIMDDRWERLLAALAGVLVARSIATWVTRVSEFPGANMANRPRVIGADDADHA